MPVIETSQSHAPQRVEIEVPPDIARIWAERADGIVKYPDPVLRRPALPVQNPSRELRDLLQRMTVAMIEGNGVGLAGPQIGVSLRVLVYRVPKEVGPQRAESETEDDPADAFEPVRALINPKIVGRKGEQIGQEGCLSIPFLRGDVPRAYEITVKAMDAHGRPIRRRASGFEARIIQHEIDHLDGILFIDRADPATLHWLVEEEGEAPIED